MGARPVIERKMYTVTCESTDEGVILHMQVEGVWSKEMKRNCFYDLALLHLAFGDLQVAISGDDPKLKKFVGLLGFRYHRSIENYEGKVFDFYVKPFPRKELDG